MRFAFNTENRSKKLSVHDFSVTFRPMTLWVPGKLQLAAAARQVDRSILKGVFFDGVQHYVDGNGYLSVIQVADSKPEEPESVCGAGNEVWLQVYKGNGELSSRILVSSCLESISLASQNSGLEEQDNDFSSIKWSEDGISIKWFSKKDCDGRSLSATHYKICGDLFCASDVLERSEAE